jgi:phosphoribosyl-ATP pyrophosphohydrolase
VTFKDLQKVIQSQSHPEQSQASQRLTNQEMSEIARKNLESNTELWKAESIYIRLEPGETVVLHFNPKR